MKLSTARSIGRKAHNAATDPTAHHDLRNNIDADDIATAFQKLDFNYMHNGNQTDQKLAKAINTFYGT